MRITSKIVQLAALLTAAGCGGAITAGEGPGDAGRDAAGDAGGGGDGGNDGSGGDAAPDSINGCGGCGCGTNPQPTKQATAAQACAILEDQGYLYNPAYGATCTQVCGQGYGCELPDAYFAQVKALNPDAGPSADGGPAPLQCPSSPATLTVTCLEMCLGRLTKGYVAPRRANWGDAEGLAARAYLEAVSVHAFERLQRELVAHAAPAALVRDARRARRDEIRHTAMTARLARKRGGILLLPQAPQVAPARSLFEIALENAVEGCVRETYGAVVGLVEAHVSPDEPLRRAMQSIAADECRHAELAWAVHAWALPRLSSDERRRVESAMREAVAEIARSDARGAAVLFNADRTAIAS
jgi:hypothetical protein